MSDYIDREAAIVAKVMKYQGKDLRHRPCGADGCCYTDDKQYIEQLEARNKELEKALEKIVKHFDESEGEHCDAVFMATTAALALSANREGE